MIHIFNVTGHSEWPQARIDLLRVRQVYAGYAPGHAWRAGYAGYLRRVSWVSLGALLGLSRAPLGSLGAFLSLSSGSLGFSWVLLELSWGTLRALLGSLGLSWALLAFSWAY